MKVRELIAELKKKPEFAQAYEDLDPQFQIAREVLRLRIELGMTQQQLAEKAGTAQSNISRLETGVARASLSVLNKLAKALGADLRIQFVRPETQRAQAEADMRNAIPVLQAEGEFSQVVHPTIPWLDVLTEPDVWHNQVKFDLREFGSRREGSLWYGRAIEAA